MSSTSCKIFRLIFAISMLNFVFVSSLAHEVEESNLSALMKNLIQVQSKLSRKVEQLEKSSSISLKMVKSAIDQLHQKIEVIDNKSKVSKSCNVCEPNPCIYGGQCLPKLCGKDFVCDKCPLFRSGLRCENLKCDKENLCWRHRDTLYVVHELRVNWTEAKRNCESEGMMLIMPKEKEQTEFIVKQLRSIYSSGTRNWFWMGIENSGSGWNWIDGSDLKSYTGGYSAFKNASSDQYGQLYLLGGDEMWTYYTIDDLAYPLCEKRDFDF